MRIHMRTPLLILALACAMLSALPSMRVSAQSVTSDNSARVIVKFKSESCIVRNTHSGSKLPHAAKPPNELGYRHKDKDPTTQRE